MVRQGSSTAADSKAVLKENFLGALRAPNPGENPHRIFEDL